MMFNVLRRLLAVVIAATLVLDALPAHARDDAPEAAAGPHVTLGWDFGGPAHAAKAGSGLKLNGVPLESARLQQAAYDNGSSGGSNAALIVIGVGVALAVVVLAAGHAAHENNPAVNGTCNRDPVTGMCQ